MSERATYVSPYWDKADIYLRPGLTPPLTFEAVDEETGDEVVFTRISDDSLTCHPNYIMVKGKMTLTKCGREECHRREPGRCQCGLHPDFLAPSGKMARGVKLDRAT